MAVNHFRALPTGTQLYVAAISTLGFATVVQSIVDIAIDPKGWSWTLLALLTLVSGSATVRLPSLPATISVSETFVFTSVLLFGPAVGTIIVALDAFVISFWTYKRGDPLYKVAFNVCALPLTIWLAAHLFFLAAGIQPLAVHPDAVSIKSLLLPLLLFTVAYFSLNSWIITFAIALEKRLPPFRIWRDNFVWVSLNYFGGASVAALLVSYTRDLDFTYLAVIVPLLLVLYFTFSMSMGRVEDANRHLRQLNSLYISTIETLAMAIDAKDQITHGHIRRVQTYAVALAKAMGVTEDKLIRAVEAAALLHDMGKLAVPEYILNKPGPLTPAEFEKMKLHASVGADILSAIDFPYPVVPIVRHHHENWDGTGYPDGLSGSGIPIGARILSVVDCFDALTSDRPYRPRLSDRDAIRILLQRRGTMYDPLVVDTFIVLHPSLIGAPDTEQMSAPLSVITEASGLPKVKRLLRLDDITASAGEVVSLFSLSKALAGPTRIEDAGSVIFGHLRRLIPHSAGVLFVYLQKTDEVRAAYACGAAASLITGMTLPVGQRLTGWVAANRQTIRNSDPVLDLGEVAKSMDPRLRSCLSTPMLVTGDLVGVLSLYSATADFFTDEHERLLEAVAMQVAPALQRSTESPEVGPTPTERLKNGPGETGEGAERLPEGTCLALIDLSTRAGELILRLEEVAGILSEHLRSKDLIFRRGRNQIVVLGDRLDESSTRRLISQTLSSSPGLKFAIVRTPIDGHTVEQLLNTADRRLRPPENRPERRVIH